MNPHTQIDKKQLATDFETSVIPRELGKLFAQVIREGWWGEKGKEARKKFKERLKSLIGRQQRLMSWRCKHRGRIECARMQRSLARAEMFRTLLKEDSLESSKRWLHTYKTLGLNAPKRLEFHAYHFSATMGDLKPMVILAVIAAHFSKFPVTLVYDDLNKFRFLTKFATYVIGENFHTRLRFEKKNNYEHRSTNTLTFSPSIGGVEADVPLDFGDTPSLTRMLTNRFVSCLLRFTSQEPHQFGSLYLPLEVPWSDDAVLHELRTFREQNASRKILVIAGSQTPPFWPEEILEWADTQTEWACIISSDKVFQMMYKKASPQHIPYILLLEQYVEYEDLVKFADFYISNCGAGSVAVALAAGCPQTCKWDTNTAPAPDKKTNAVSLTKFLKVGPVFNESLDDTMVAVNKNLGSYKEAAQKAAQILKDEYKTMMHNLRWLFQRLSSDPAFQEQVRLKGIPAKYALPTAECNRMTQLEKRV